MTTTDGQLLSLIWNNFISNAIKFTPENGKITVRLQKLGELIQVSVQDSGCGMDEKTMSHIFEKFYQADSSHATKGNGLGLALVQRIVQLCGGTITAESPEECGAVFTVRLPLHKQG